MDSIVSYFVDVATSYLYKFGWIWLNMQKYKKITMYN